MMSFFANLLNFACDNNDYETDYNTILRHDAAGLMCLKPQCRGP